MRGLISALFLATCGLLVAGAHAQSYHVVGVTDGDTLNALDMNNRQLTCRLYGIDAPERKQPFGQVAKMTLSRLTFNRKVSIEFLGRDRYRRDICKIKIAGVDVNREMIAKGMAWMYRRYTSDSAYSAAEDAARIGRLGVWVDQQPTPPWEFRHRRKK